MSKILLYLINQNFRFIRNETWKIKSSLLRTRFCNWRRKEDCDECEDIEDHEENVKDLSEFWCLHRHFTL